jgi:hypothetical protein
MADVLQIDGEQIKRFHDCLFRYADDGWISCRSFFDDSSGVFEIQAVKANNTESTVPAIIAAADRATQSSRATVFCPPVAIFSNTRSATETDIVNGLALSVECDQRPNEARRILEVILGQATLVIQSGGEWVNPETGEVEDKLHLHWRLTEPTRDNDSHAQLKKARTLATALVGGDVSNKPIVHPIRWPGTWHRKKTPRLATIVSETSGEIDLGEAVEALSEALAGSGVGLSDDIGKTKGEPSGGTGESRETSALISEIISGRDYHAPVTALAMRYLMGGMPDAQVVLTLRGVMDAVPTDIRDMKDGTIQTGRWQARYDDIPRAVSTARQKTVERPQEPKQSPLMSAGDFLQPAPRRQWIVEKWIPKGCVTGLFGSGGTGKSLLAQQLGTVLATNDFGGKNEQQ